MACGSESTAQDRQPDGAGASDGINLFAYIDRDRVWGLNVEPPEAAKDAIKPWDQRHSLDTYTESSVDDQLIITIPFICPVRVQSILLHVGRGDLAPTVRSLCILTQRCVAYVNLPDGLDFEHAAMADGRVGPPASGRPQADFALLPGATDVTTYPCDSATRQLTRVYYIGFIGTPLDPRPDASRPRVVPAASSATRPVDGVTERSEAVAPGIR